MLKTLPKFLLLLLTVCIAPAPLWGECLPSEVQIAALEKPPEWYAAKAGLRYTQDGDPGFTRRLTKDGFTYYEGRRRVRDAKIIDQIESWKIPPAAESVWINKDPKGHIRAKWSDTAGRSQAMYHSKWIAIRSKYKYQKTGVFGLGLSNLRSKVKQDLKSEVPLSREQVHAVVTRIMDKQGIRVGNEKYASENETYGLTTIQKRHVTLKGNTIRLRFTGKSSKEHDISLTDKDLAPIIKKLLKRPGNQLFIYQQGDKSVDVTSSSLNNYVKQGTGGPFSAKNFRTWIATSEAFTILSKVKPPKSDAEAQKLRDDVLLKVSKKLGNTPEVAGESYIYSEIFRLHRTGKLSHFLKEGKALKIPNLSPQERATIVMLGGLE